MVFAQKCRKIAIFFEFLGFFDHYDPKDKSIKKLPKSKIWEPKVLCRIKLSSSFVFGLIDQNLTSIVKFTFMPVCPVVQVHLSGNAIFSYSW